LDYVLLFNVQQVLLLIRLL